MNAQISKAITDLTRLHVGDAVKVTDQGQTYTMTVSRAASRSDGVYGSPESTHVTVTFGPGRYAFEVRAEKLASGAQKIEVL